MSFLDSLQTSVPIMGRYAKGWPAHDFDRAIEYRTLGNALADTHDSDAHFAAYSVPSVLRRLAGQRVFEILAPVPVTMVLFLVDVEPTGHAEVTPEWWTAERVKLDSLLADHPHGFVYRTRGGYRVVYELADHVTLRSPTDAERWKATYTAWLTLLEVGYGIVADRACKDWTRLYRLPRVVRDGVPQEPETIGDPHHIGTWSAVVEIGSVTLSEVRYEPENEEHDWPPASAALLERSASRLRAIGSAIEGQGGNDTTYRACAALLHDHALSMTEAWPLLREWNATCKPPWIESELRDVADNAMAYAKGVRGTGRREFEALGLLDDVLREHGVEPISEPTPTQPAPEIYPSFELAVLSQLATEYAVLPAPAGKPGEWEYEIARARRDVARAFGSADAEIANRPLFVPAGELFSRAYPPTSWLIRHLIAQGGIAVVSTEPKSAKTWTLTEMALAVATGTNAFGHEYFGTVPMHVRYFYAEDLEVSIRNRLRALAASRGMTPEAACRNLHIQPRGRELDITRDEDMALIIASCRMLDATTGPTGFLCLDPLRNVHTGKESDSDEMAPVMQRLHTISSLLNCTVGIVHHASKPSKETAGRRPGQTMRGSSAIYSNINSGIYLGNLKVNDERNVFSNLVESEVKGAKSASPFTLTLSITDNADGEAVAAAWKVERKGDADASRIAASDGEVATDDAAISLIAALDLFERRKEAPKTVEQLRDGMRSGKARINAAIAYASAKGWILKNVKGRWQLTDTGRKMADPTIPADNTE